MAATYADITGPQPLAGKVIVQRTVTYTGVTTDTWNTGLFEVEHAGFEIVSGTGQGDVLISTSTRGLVTFGSVTAMTAADVVTQFAIGTV